MSEVTISDVLEDIRTIEFVINAYIDHVSPEILALIPEEKTALREKVAAVDDILLTYFRRIHARIDGKDAMDLD